MIPLYFHNMSRYDSHFIVQELTKVHRITGYTVIPSTSENFISIILKIKARTYLDKKTHKYVTKYISVRILDSYRFMSAALDTLANNLSYEDHKLSIKYASYMLYKHNNYSEDNVKLLLRKGVFPYEYLDDITRLDDTHLPPIDNFYSLLKGVNISKDEYTHAQKVWDTYHCKTLRDFTTLYNMTDTKLLADVFEKFRDVCMKNYDLDAAHYYTSPGFFFNAMLKYTGVKLELFTDYDMSLFIKQGIRGGISTAPIKYAKANNKYMEDEFNPNEPSVYLQYHDANALYGGAMCDKLPMSEFKWMTEDELTNWEKFDKSAHERGEEVNFDILSDFNQSPTERLTVSRITIRRSITKISV
jgi:hypothetical protein